MEKGLFNITEAGTTTLIPIYGESGNVRSISLANTSSLEIIVDLFLQDSIGQNTYIIKTAIPSNVTLVLDDDMSFDNSVLGLILTTTAGSLSASTPLSIIIK
tara:strand:+ start:495 stop:800 length:306 start_codon:yes stop_codon:yes gene_type:complete